MKKNKKILPALSILEQAVRSSLAPVIMSSSKLRKVAIAVDDPIYKRLLEGVVTSLDLEFVAFETSEIREEHLFQFEMIITDESKVRTLRPMLQEQDLTGDVIKPALVAIVNAPYFPISKEKDSEDFDAVLALPEHPSLLNAQLSVALYAHRAFAQRYQSALEELRLNRSIFKSVTSGISVANAQLPDMPLMYVNPAFEAMTGYCLEEVIGKNCRFLQAQDNNQPGLTLIREAIKLQSEKTAVVKNYRKDGTSFWNQLALSPIRNREGVLTHFVGIQMDVTERVEFEIALRESEKLAAVGRLASSISHEINNPLEAITNLVYLANTMLPEGEATNSSRDFLRQADIELQRIKHITSQSLRFYKQSHNPEAITVKDLISPILDVFRSKLTNSATVVNVRYRSSQHLVCLASEIRQVISNLLANAIDALAGINGRIDIRTREATDWRNGNKGMVITIRDTGIGMTKEVQDNIYKPFFTTKGENGTGLGLWISSEIITRHHGHLRVRSTKHTKYHGTVFELFLPFQAVSGSSEDTDQSNN